MTLLLVFAGGAIGAPARYVLDRLIMRRRRGPFPWGTLVVNLVGSVILGALAGAQVSGAAASLVGVGFCGALTTFSTFGYETVRLAEDGRTAAAAGYAAASLLLGVTAAATAYAAASWLL
ncbi:fluoride efflux transporter CrcB [Spirillospora sp. NPDC047279]|uniref:fluoride efflux transporter CrcB n=1 Tax=Spirillospora sp. NPDC047279 TaxID=3155478 RepID=UPI00340435A3